MQSDAFQGSLPKVTAIASIRPRVLVISALIFFMAHIDASAGAAPRLGIAKFTVETTQVKQVPSGPGVLGPGFENEPYPYTQAGGHPPQLTTRLEFTSKEVEPHHALVPTGDPKDIITDLPVGYTANPLAVPRCEMTQGLPDRKCPPESQVGVFVVHAIGTFAILGPIIDVTPESGQSAEFLLQTPINSLHLDGRLVRTAQGYAIRVVNRNLPELAVTSVETTLWGVPAAPEHDAERGLSCFVREAKGEWSCGGGGIKSSALPVPFLTMPSACAAGPEAATMWADSWEERGQYQEVQSRLPAVTNCYRMTFTPGLEVQPQTVQADEPVGLSINMENYDEDPLQAVVTPPTREATVTLPQGVTMSPAVADGIQGCNERGPAGINIPTGLNADGEPPKPEEIGEGEERFDNEGQLAPGHCPEASIVGTAEAYTPLLPQPLKGHVYLASPICGGSGQRTCTETDAADGDLYRTYIELDDAAGRRRPDIVVKMEGKVEANLATGQLTVKLDNNPQLPLTQLVIHLNGGPRALLDNPTICGLATTTSDLKPWSATGVTPPPESQTIFGTQDAHPTSFYEVQGCSNPLPFHPSLQAGTLTPEAGAFSGFTATIAREDGEQFLSGIQMRAPLGLSALLSSVPLCDARHAETGTCPQASRVGTSRVWLGAGPSPFEMTGNIYLTAGYEGAPFGLSIVTNAIAGPLNFGLVIIRARVDIDPETSALTITGRSLPQIVFGALLRMRRLKLDIDRPNFIFNPTNCAEQKITAAIVGSNGTTTDLSNRFEIGGCRDLIFKAVVTAKATVHAGDPDGAGLDIRLKRPHLPVGSQANVASMQMSLPKQLAVRLTALRNACPQRVFTDNPADCPHPSIVGTARASTPVLPVQLTGPVYLVAHGRASFPATALVLQGDGVRINAIGITRIGRKGIARIIFPTIPDVPITTFEIQLPRGPQSMLDASPNICDAAYVGTKSRKSANRIAGARHRVNKHMALAMPTELVAHNGAVMHIDTKVAVTGCTNRLAATHRDTNGK
jgi:hypothetical protein